MSKRNSLSPSSPMDFGECLFNDDDEKLLSSLLDSPRDLSAEEAGFERCPANPETDEDVRKPAAIPRSTSIDPMNLATLIEQDDFVLACQLQKADDDGCTNDFGIDAVTTGNMPLRNCGEYVDSCDYRLALQLQGEEDDALMLSSYAGQAWKFVEELFQLYRSHDSRTPGFSDFVAPIGRDDLVFVAERFFQTVEMFQRQGKSCHVDLGYHYTRSANLDRIRTDGLLSKHERETSNVRSHFNGSSFGDGIYTAKNPFAFHGRYGDVGLVTARLHGSIGPAGGMLECDSTLVHSGKRNEFSVLKTCGQCLPIFQFKSSLVMPNVVDHPGNFQLFRLHEDLQSLLDYFINKLANSLQKIGCGQVIPEIALLNTRDSTTMPAADSSLLFRSLNDRILASPISVPICEAASGLDSTHLVSPLSADKNRIAASNEPGSQIQSKKAVYPSHDHYEYSPSSHVNAEQRLMTISLSFGFKRPADVHFIAPTPKKPRKRIYFNAGKHPIGEAALYGAKGNITEESKYLSVQTLADDHLFRHVRECTFSKLSENCTICSQILMLKKNGKMVQLHRCGHCFHENCLRTSLKNSRHCPSCHASLDPPASDRVA